MIRAIGVNHFSAYGKVNYSKKADISFGTRIPEELDDAFMREFVRNLQANMMEMSRVRTQGADRMENILTADDKKPVVGVFITRSTNSPEYSRARKILNKASDNAHDAKKSANEAFSRALDLKNDAGNIVLELDELSHQIKSRLAAHDEDTEYLDGVSVYRMRTDMSAPKLIMDECDEEGNLVRKTSFFGENNLINKVEEYNPDGSINEISFYTEKDNNAPRRYISNARSYANYLGDMTYEADKELKFDMEGRPTYCGIGYKKHDNRRDDSGGVSVDYARELFIYYDKNTKLDYFENTGNVSQIIYGTDFNIKTSSVALVVRGEHIDKYSEGNREGNEPNYRTYSPFMSIGSISVDNCCKAVHFNENGTVSSFVSGYAKKDNVVSWDEKVKFDSSGKPEFCSAGRNNKKYYGNNYDEADFIINNELTIDAKTGKILCHDENVAYRGGNRVYIDKKTEFVLDK